MTQKYGRGFSTTNLRYFSTFYTVYADRDPEIRHITGGELNSNKKRHIQLAPLVRALSWSKNLLILGQCKTSEEKEFYLLCSARANRSKRELQSQIQRSSFELTMLADLKLAPPVRELHQVAVERTSISAAGS